TYKSYYFVFSKRKLVFIKKRIKIILFSTIKSIFCLLQKEACFHKKKNQNYFIFYNKIHIFESAYLLTNKK
ncbi:hypothetical protein DW048_23495, partial [Phocaeicola vulgatus]